MKLLLDTHVFLWWLENPRRISRGAHAQIEDTNNALYVSVISVWEIAIKEALGKLTVPPQFQHIVASGKYPIIPIQLNHVDHLRGLPLHHRDPFDRMLLAQSTAEGLTLITNDAALKRYNVPILLA